MEQVEVIGEGNTNQSGVGASFTPERLTVDEEGEACVRCIAYGIAFSPRMRSHFLYSYWRVLNHWMMDWVSG